MTTRPTPCDTPRIRRTAAAALLSLLATLWATGAAQAAPVTFAQFTETNSSINAFSFTNNGTLTTPPTMATYTASTGVNFFFSVDGLPSTVIPATLTLSATTSTHENGVRLIDQPVDSGTLSITTPTTNLLTATFAPGDLTGVLGSRAASLTSSTDSGSVVTFSSSLLNFSQTVSRSLSLSFTSLITTIGGGGLATDGNFFSSFTASGAGTFSSEPPPLFAAVPEPTSAAMLATGLLAVPVVLTLRRRQSSPRLT